MGFFAFSFASGLSRLRLSLYVLALLGACAARAEPGYATVWRIQGDVTATPADTSVARKLALGDAVYVNERVRADVTAEVVLQTADQGLIAVRPGAAFVAERFVAKGKATDHATLRVVEGGLRLITGWIGRLNKREYRIVTPTATIGIRGTDHEPFVVSAALAATLSQPAGTYDKVNRGGTVLEANGNLLNIDPGKVGFAREVKPIKTRALMTLVLPVLLDKVPGFYVPGQFDAEMDQFSAAALDTTPAPLDAQRKAKVCDAKGIAQAWLAQLDGAIARRDTAAVLALFATDVVVRATVRDQAGARVTLELPRDEFSQSTVAAVNSLSNYTQRRVSTQAKPLDGLDCERIAVKSVVIEQGKQGGKPYRFESTEDYVLALQGGQWTAVQAQTRQR